jgi:eukaryotic-like serine/threonine-protein kinase
MSRVFVAREAALGRDVVIKVLPPEMAAGVSIERFKREIAVAAKLQQANIVPLLAAGDADGLPYYVMPYVRGESLRARLARDGELPVADAIGILREVARALSNAHEHGVVHRDIKPDNVLLSGGSAVVSDFGVAKALTAASGGENVDITDLGMALGTPAYMSPEQASADPHVDHRADIYAFGCMAYELLTGQTPFTGRSPAATLAAHVSERPEPVERRRPSIPTALGALVARCLEKRPSDRPQTAQEVLHALDALSTPSGGMQPTRGMPAARARRSTSLVAIGAGVIALAVIAVFAVKALRSTSTDAAIHSVAVLPFENVGGDTATAYFADGMRDELATALGKVPSLSVASRTSSYAFRGKSGVTPRDIGHSLGVDAILEGTVRRSGDQLRISAQLTRASTGLGLWSESFDRKMTDVFALQEELARAIASTLGSAVRGGRSSAAPTISVAKSRGTSNQQAYDFYLRGRYLLNTRQQLSRALSFFESATRLDSSFAQAFAAATSAAALLPYYEGIAAPDALRRARTYAAKALAIDSTLAEPHAALGLGLSNTFAFGDAEREFQTAIAVDSTLAFAYHQYGFMLLGIGRYKEAVPFYEKAVRLDPLSGVIAQSYSDALILVGRDDDALAAGERILAVDSSETALVTVMLVYAHRHQWAEALKIIEPVRDAAANRLTQVFVGLGQRREADSVRALLEARVAHGGLYADVAVAYAALGDATHTLQWLERAIDRYDGGLLAARIPTNPVFDFVRDDPRFVKLLARTGIPARP